MENFVKVQYNFVEEVDLNNYLPVLFLKKQQLIFKSKQYSIEEKLKLLQLDTEGLIYSDSKFNASFLRKMEIDQVGFIALKYSIKDKIKYVIFLKSFAKINSKYLLLK